MSWKILHQAMLPLNIQQLLNNIYILTENHSNSQWEGKATIEAEENPAVSVAHPNDA